MRNCIRVALFIALLLSSLSALAQSVSPNTARGFDADKTYSIDDVDAINLFNGNLNVSVPLGGKFVVSPTLSYQFVLSYGGNNWEYEVQDLEVPGTFDPVQYITRGWGYPSRHDNAGFGWRLHFGRLQLADSSLTTGPGGTAITYESPDGAVHSFYTSLHSGHSEEEHSGTWYTRDGSYLRLHDNGTSSSAPYRYQIEFPDGTIHYFASMPTGSWPPVPVQEIDDRFGNWVKFDYQANGPSSAVPAWKIWDSKRTHYVDFKPTPAYNETVPQDDHAVPHFSIDKVRIVGPGGVLIPYTLHYFGEGEGGSWTKLTFTRPEGTARLTWRNDDTVTTAVLEHIDLPIGSYSFDYDRAAVPQCDHCGGVLTDLTYPTGGKVRWNYVEAEFPENKAAIWRRKAIGNFDFGTHFYDAAAVAERILSNADNTTVVAKRTYARSTALGGLVPFEERVLETDLDANGTILSKSMNFFSVCVTQCTPPVAQGDYGLPFTKAVSRPSGDPFENVVISDGSGRYLSRIEYGAGANWTTIARRVYIGYDADVAPEAVGMGVSDVNRRPKAQRTYFDDDPPADGHYVDTLSDLFDGLGHYRKTTASGSFGLTKIATTNYNPAHGTFPGSFTIIPWDDPWITETYTSSKTEQGALSSHVDTCFNATTGFLERKRTARDIADHPERDLVSVFIDANQDGFVDAEESYGGDSTPLPDSFDTCNGALSSPPIRINHEYTNGVLTSSQYQGINFKSVNLLVDLSGAVTDSIDPSGLITSFKYDELGRITELHPPGAAWTQYVHNLTPTSTTTGANVAVYAWGKDVPSPPSGTPITESHHYYDNFGRLIQSRVKVPPMDDGSEWTVSGSVYDAMGRRTKTYALFGASSGDFSVIPTSNAATTTTYDTFGRPLTVTQPDNGVTSLTYAGARETTRTTYIQTSATGLPEAVSVKETRDIHGRLTQIEEGIPVGGNGEVTTYGYDEDDRLVEVTQGVQKRTFDYDGAGLLKEEVHPESGATTMTYDARGHLRQRFAANGKSLELKYDDAERLVETKDELGRLLKQFSFGNTPGPRLLSQTRYNYFATGPTTTVTDAFTYEAATGRVASKTTTVARNGVSTEFKQDYAFTDLGQLRKLQYPICQTCGAIPGNSDRPIDLEYQRGLLTNIAGVTAPITGGRGIIYGPSGMTEQVLHSNGVLETITPDPKKMARPARYQFTNVRDCALITTQPLDTSIGADHKATFTVATVPNATVTWYEGLQGDKSKPTGNTGNSFTTPELSKTTWYWCAVTLGSGCESKSNSVEAIWCPPAAITVPAVDYTGDPIQVPGPKISLSITASGGNLKYEWFRIVSTMNASGTWIAGTEDPIGTNSPSLVDFPIAAGTRVTFNVTVTGTGCGAGTDHRVVTSIEVSAPHPGKQQCPPPKLLSNFPGEVEFVPLRTFPVLKPVIEPWDPTLPAGQLPLGLERDEHLEYRWYLNGTLLKSSDGSVFNPTSYQATTSGVTIMAEVWRKCSTYAVPAGTTPYEDASAAVNTRAAFVYDVTHCPPPPLNIDRPTLVQTTDLQTIHASSPWPTVTFQWYRGDSGNTHRPIAGATGPDYTPPVGIYWVRATSPCGSISDSPTILVYPSGSTCVPLQIMQHPASADVTAKLRYTLTYLSLPDESTAQWFTLDDGGHDVYLRDGRDLVIERPMKTASYWVRVSNACSFNESKIATLRVTACDDVTIAQQPQSVSISEHQNATLSVSANSNFALSYQWYVGESGDTSHPVATGGTSSTLSLIDPPITAKYWVRIKVAGGCEVDSATATVWVCRTPVVSQGSYEILSAMPGQYQWLDASATGDNLEYQWYEGTVGDTSRPVMEKVRSVLVNPYNTTLYWFRATSLCQGTQRPYADSIQWRITICPVINAQPAAQYPEVMQGTAATITIDTNVIPATGDRIEWYVGDPGETQPVPAGTGAVFHPIINAPTKFWALVSSGTCSRWSDSVTVGTCTQPTAYFQPILTEVAAGVFQTLQVLGSTSGVYAADTTIYQGPFKDTVHSTILNGPGPTSVSYQIHPNTTTTYWAHVQETSGCSADTQITVNVCIPTIVTQPQPVMIDKIANPQASATLTVAATGDNLHYAWYIGNTGDVSQPTGTNQPSLTVSPNADTKYWVYIVGTCGNGKSSVAAQVSVCAPAQIANQPINKTAAPSATLNVTATGTDLAYQWYRGLSGDTTNPLSTGASLTVTPSVTTNYWVKVSGRCGPSVNSATAKVSVAPVITTQPAGGFIVSGATRTLSVVASGTELSYVWSKDGVAISGANGPSYTTPAITANATYTVRVTSGDVSIDSDPATLTVCSQPTIGWLNTKTQVMQSEPQILSVATSVSGTYASSYTWYTGNAGDVTGSTVINGPGPNLVQFSISPSVTTKYWVRISETSGCYADTTTLTVQVCVPTITTPPQSVMINKIANPQASATLSVAANGGTLTYQWYIGASGVTTNPIANQTGSQLTVSPDVDTTYWVRVSGSCGVVRDSAAATVSLCKAPAITTQPANVTLANPASTTLSVAATGTSLTYQWYSGTSGNTASPISGQTSASYQFTANGTADYWVKVSGTCGSINSNTAKVSIAPVITTQPAGGAVTKGSVRTLTVAANGAQLAYQWYSGASTSITGATSPSYTTPAINADITYWARVFSGNASTDSSQAVFTVCQPRTVVIASNPSVSNSAVTLQVSATASGETYEWYLGESGVTTTQVGSGSSFIVYPLGTSRYWVRTKRTGCDADSPAVTVTVCYPSISSQPQGGMITTGSTKTMSVVASGTAPMTYQWYTGDSGVTTSPISNATGSSWTTPALTTTTKYWVQVRAAADASCGSTSVNSSTATVSVCVPPAITQQPQNATLPYSSSSAVVRVIATGDGLTYQWYEGNAGDTSHPLGTTSQITVTPGTTKSYWARVTGTCGTAVNSTAALLSVTPAILSQPPNSMTVCQNSSNTFTVSASGSPLLYQWYKSVSGGAYQSFATTASATTVITAPTDLYCTITSGNASVSTWPTSISITPAPYLSVGRSLIATNYWRLDAYISSDDVGMMNIEWFKGQLGDTSQPWGQGSYIAVSVPPSATFWVRGTHSETGCAATAGPISVP